MRFKFLHIASFCITAFAPALTALADNGFELTEDDDLYETGMLDKPLVFNDPKYKHLDGRTLIAGEGHQVTYEYLPQRRTLTGEMCFINKIINTVDVGSGQKDMDRVLNDNLDDYGEFISTAAVGVGYNPLVSIRDKSCYYAKGTTAGFSIVAGSGSTVLSVDLLNALSITFYRDGENVGTASLDNGQSAGGIGLSLVNIPGSGETSAFLETTAPAAFDEISLDIDGVTIGVGQLYRIKYAYVGDASVFTITRNQENGSIAPKNAPDDYVTPFQAYREENRNVRFVKTDCLEFPVLVGGPVPDSEQEEWIDEDLTGNEMSIVSVASIGYVGDAGFYMEDTADPNREVYEAGMEVGFAYKIPGVLTLSLISDLEVEFYDRKGNVVQTSRVSTDVLGLNVVNVGNSDLSVKSTVPFSGAKLKIYGGLNVGVTYNMLYAYVRYAPTIRHHCPINPSGDTTICEEQTVYQLKAGMPVTWELTDFIPKDENNVTHHASVTPDGRVSGLDCAGQYVFTATAEDGCTDRMILAYDMFPDTVEMQGTPLVNELNGNAHYELSTGHNGESSGGLLIIDNLENAENVVGDPTLAATYVGGLKLADNNLIVGVKRTDSDIVNYARDKEENLNADPVGTRVGFVFSSTTVGLNISALHFYNIRCFKEGKEVYRHVVDESNAVSAGLGGSNSHNMLRYSIVVPWLNDDLQPIDFDEIQLWSSGVLDLGGSNLDIYYAFTEEGSIDNSNPLDCSTEILTTENSHATIDYAMMGNPSLVKALGAMNNLSYLLDDDLETSLDDVHVAGVAARTTIPVLLGRTLDFRQELGIVMRNDTYVAGVDLGKGLTVYTMYKGEKTGDEFSDWGVLGADVAGFGDKNIFYIHPTCDYDEVVIDYGQGVEVAGTTQFCGIVVRKDSDHDGIPDCLDPCSCMENVDMIIPDVCVGQTIEFSGEGIPGNFYTAIFTDPAIAADRPEIPIETEYHTGTNFRISYTTTQPGYYHVKILNSRGEQIFGSAYEVHPRLTEWRADAASTSWNDRANWSEGSPYCCTDVIIPSDAVRYPVLKGLNKIGDEFCCNRILIRPGGAIEGIYKLNYTYAWVQLELSPNTYHLLSAPLQGMVTGDMFIPQGNGMHEPETLFEVLNEENNNSAENRFDPTIYQRMWHSNVLDHCWNNSDITMTEYDALPNLNMAKWSQNFNHVNTPYNLAEGFSVWVDNGKLPENRKFRFTFPKENKTYRYFSDFDRTEVSGSAQTVNRNGRPGRFIHETGDSIRIFKYDGIDRTIYDLDKGLRATIAPTGLKSGETIQHFLLGNPFMSHLDARRLIEANSDVVKGLMWYDGNTTTSLIYDPETETFASTGAPDYIDPMTAVFVVTREDVNSLNVDITRDMILPKGADEQNAAAGTLVSAIAEDAHAAMFVAIDEALANAALFDSEVTPRLAIFAQTDGTAHDIVAEDDQIPLTLINTTGANVKLTFANVADTSTSWNLLDRATGISVEARGEIELPAGCGSSTSRFVLTRKSAPSLVEDITYIETGNGQITAFSATGGITRLEIFSLDGTSVADVKSGGCTALSTSAPSGICIARVTANGVTKSYKILLN